MFEIAYSATNGKFQAIFMNSAGNVAFRSVHILQVSACFVFVCVHACMCVYVCVRVRVYCIVYGGTSNEACKVSTGKFWKWLCTCNLHLCACVCASVCAHACVHKARYVRVCVRACVRVSEFHAAEWL